MNGENTLAELARLYDVHTTLINQWRSRLLEGASDVFGSEPSPAKQVVDVTVLHGKVDELTRVKDPSSQMHRPLFDAEQGRGMGTSGAGHRACR